MFNNFYKKKKVLIIGNTGFKGSWLSIWLLKLGADVYGLSKNIPTKPSLFQATNLNKKYKTFYKDINYINDIYKVVNKVRPQIIFHLAAQPLVVQSYKSPFETFMTNSFGFNNVIEVIRNSSFVKTAILVTSDKVYENVEKKNGYKETDRLAGIDPYSASKSCAEIIYKSYFKSFLINTNLKSAIGRAGNVIGGGDWADNRIIPDIVRSKYKKKKLIIKNPNSTRPWQHVLEPISGYLLLGQILNSNNQKVNGESFNFGPPSNQNKKVRELLNIFNKKIKFKKHNDKKLYESKLLKLNCKKASKFLYWKSVLNFKTLLQFTSEWYENFYIKKKNSFNFTVDQIKKYENIAKKKKLKWAKF